MLTLEKWISFELKEFKWRRRWSHHSKMSYLQEKMFWANVKFLADTEIIVKLFLVFCPLWYFRSASFLSKKMCMTFMTRIEPRSTKLRSQLSHRRIQTTIFIWRARLHTTTTKLFFIRRASLDSTSWCFSCVKEWMTTEPWWQFFTKRYRR